MLSANSNSSLWAKWRSSSLSLSFSLFICHAPSVAQLSVAPIMCVCPHKCRDLSSLTPSLYVSVPHSSTRSFSVAGSTRILLLCFSCVSSIECAPLGVLFSFHIRAPIPHRRAPLLLDGDHLDFSLFTFLIALEPRVVYRLFIHISGLHWLQCSKYILFT